MIARRRVLAGSAALAAGVLTGCAGPPASGPSSGPAPSPSTDPPSTTATGRPDTSPSRTATAGPTQSPSPDRSATPSRSTTPTGPPRPRLTGTIADGLDVPWGMVFLRSGTAVVGERNTGRLLTVTAKGKVTTLGEVKGVVAPTGLGEGGLLGLALAPGDEDTLFAYLTTGSDNRVVRFSIAGGRVSTPRSVLTGIPTSVHHHGGKLQFDDDGMLFVSTGDAEQSALAQRTGSLAGKILRIRPDGRAAAGNPYGNRTYSHGHRNVEGLAFDAAGRLWATEFGDKAADELNLIRRGGNYGWPDAEGRTSGSRYVTPAATWSPTSTCSPAGLAITRSTAFVGALRGRCLFSVALSGTRAARPVAHFSGDHGRIRAVAVAPDGALWITTSNTDGRVDPGRDDDKILRVAL